MRRMQRRAEPLLVPDLRYRYEIDLPLTLVMGATWITTEALRPKIARRRCHWCALNEVDQATRDAFRWSDPEPAALVSDIFAYGITPAAIISMDLALAHESRALRVVHEDLLIIFEAIATSAAVTQAIKFGSGRQRPYARFADAPIPFDEDPDQNLGFNSGHTALVFATAVSAGTVATMRRYRLAPVVWGVGLPLAAFTGYLRIAGDRHYLGDVLVGTAVGGTFGFGLPWLLHHPKTGIIPRRRGRDGHAAASLRVVPAGRGMAVTGRF